MYNYSVTSIYNVPVRMIGTCVSLHLIKVRKIMHKEGVIKTDPQFSDDLDTMKVSASIKRMFGDRYSQEGLVFSIISHIELPNIIHNIDVYGEHEIVEESI